MNENLRRRLCRAAEHMSNLNHDINHVGRDAISVYVRDFRNQWKRRPTECHIDDPDNIYDIEEPVVVEVRAALRRDQYRALRKLALRRNVVCDQCVMHAALRVLS